jgi:hypothetical protein
MGYYMGDYYAGSRGDPGLGSFFKGALGMGLGAIPGVGGIARGVLGKLGGAATKGRAVIARGGEIIMKHPVMTGAGAAGIALAAGAAGERMIAGGGGGGLRGFHHCKSKKGCKHGEWVRNRRMNVCNPRALRRAIRRTHGFAKLAMRTIHLVHPKKKARFGGFKRKSKK